MRALLAISIGINACLLAVLLGLWRGQPAPQSEFQPIPAMAPAEAEEFGTEGGSSLEFAGNASDEKVFIHWSQIEDADLHLFMANLRAIGCPEGTIHDILHSEVQHRFESRRAELVAGQLSYWELLQKQGSIDSFFHFQQYLFDPVKSEIAVVLNDLLGRHWERRFRRMHMHPQVSTSPQISHLEPGKQQEWEAIEEEFRTRRQKLLDEAGPRTPETAAALEAIENERNEARRALMTDAEWEEYRLRRSAGVQWQQRLSGFEPADEEEFRTLARLYNAFSEEIRSLRSGSFDSPAELELQMKEAQRRKDEAFIDVLGSERFAEVRRGESQEYRLLLRIIDRHDLPQQSAARAHEIVQSAHDMMKQWRSLDGIAEPEQQTLLREIRNESMTALEQTLGARAFETLQHRGRGPLFEWLQLSTGEADQPPD
jgi:hypothetical protein